MGAVDQKRFPRQLTALEEIFRLISDFCSKHQLGDDVRRDVDLIVEELFTNCLKYNTEGAHPVEISLSREADELEIKVTDFDVHEFDITKAPRVDVDKPLAERRPGGLGIHLIRKLAAHVSYEYARGNSIIRVIKRLEA